MIKILLAIIELVFALLGLACSIVIIVGALLWLGVLLAVIVVFGVVVYSVIVVIG